MDEATLTYLTNPVYFSEITKHVDTPTSNDDDVRFYRRRLISLYKDILGGEKLCEPIDLAHKEFVRLAIAHFKRVDKDEILQKDHDAPLDADHDATIDADHDATIDADHDATIDTDNTAFFKKEISVPTLDDFILSTKPDVPQTPPPHKRVINLRDEQFRHKGVTKKQVSIYEV